MSLHEEIQQVFAPLLAETVEKKGVTTVKYVVAERKFLLAKKKLVYTAKYRIDEKKREVRFTEMLKESGFGISGGSEFKKETYKTGSGEREGVIEEQSNFLGKKYNYTFDFKAIREQVKKKAQEAGFTFEYRVTPFGL